MTEQAAIDPAVAELYERIDLYQSFTPVSCPSDLLGRGNRILEYPSEAGAPAWQDEIDTRTHILCGRTTRDFSAPASVIQPRVIKAENILVFPNGMLMDVASRKILLDSFRFATRRCVPLITHPDAWIRVTGRARIDRMLRREPLRLEERSLSYLSTHRGFGHVLLEATSRLWPALMPELHDATILASPIAGDFNLAFLSALDIRPRRIVQPRQAIIADELIIGSQAFVLHLARSHLFSDLVDRFRFRCGEKVAREKRLFVSRADSNHRRLTNESEIEAIFINKGFEIVRPAKLSIPEQIRLFARADWIAGECGSAMYNSVWAADDVNKILLCPANFVTRNNWLLNPQANVFLMFGSATDPAAQLQVGDWSIDTQSVMAALDTLF